MRTVEIPGGTATLRTPDEVRRRDVQIIKAAAVAAAGAINKVAATGIDPRSGDTDWAVAANLTISETIRIEELNDAAAVALLAGWTLDRPLPTLDTIGDLPDDLVDALATAVAPDVPKILGGVDFEPPDPKSEGFDESPIVPSDGSAPVSRDDPAHE